MKASLLRLVVLALVAACAAPPATAGRTSAERPRAQADPPVVDDDDDDDGDDGDGDDAGSGDEMGAGKYPGLHRPLPDSLAPAALHAALSDAERAVLDRGLRLVTFEQQISERGGRTRLHAVSLGTLLQPPAAVRSVLAEVGGYPDWVILHPSYKSVRVQGKTRMTAEIGSADARKAKRTMVYAIAPDDEGARWTVVESGSPLQPGSSIEFIVAPHPVIPDASLVAHVQTGLLGPGRMLRYLSAEDSDGRNRWWKDSNRHARRIHWAIDAAVTQPPGRERQHVYIGHFQREFGGKVPVWAD